MQRFFYDLETTHLDPFKGGIHQISGIIEVDNKIVEKVNYKVCPYLQDEIDPKSLEIGGVTEKEIKKYPKPDSVFVDLCFKLIKYKKEPLYTAIGYNNGSFDDKFLRRFFLKNQRYFSDFFYNIGIDVMYLASFALEDERDKIASLSLKNVAKYLDLKVDGQLHNAAYDVELTYKIYKKLKGEL